MSARCPQSQTRWLLLFLPFVLFGCGAPKESVSTRGATVVGGPVRVASAREGRGHAGRLLVTLTATAPAAIEHGSVVRFSVTAHDARGRGAFGYELHYGDGTSAGQHTAALVCIAGRGAPMGRVWRLSHAYRAAGVYRVSVSVYANCTGAHASASVTVRVG
jgi:hypothetical protein